MNAAQLFFDRAQSAMCGQQVSGRTLGGPRLSVAVATKTNVHTGWGLGFYPSWRLTKAGVTVATSEELSATSQKDQDRWLVAAQATALLHGLTVQELVLDQGSGLLVAVFAGDVELHALGPEPGEPAAWYIRDLEAHWVLTGTASGLQLGPDV